MDSGWWNRGAKKPIFVVIASVLVLALTALYAAAPFEFRSRQEVVADRGEQVMPFDLERTTHIFNPTPDGGVQKVVADDPTEQEQVSLIQEHLKKEAAAFADGDLSDPAAIHGRSMPGLEELEMGTDRITIRYSDLPNGGQITYTTEDSALVAALHDWFQAQLSDHGQHATGHDSEAQRDHPADR